MKKSFNIAVIMTIIFLFVVAAYAQNKDKKVLYYRNPMNPEVTSPVFMKDSMGMDYIPVYEEEEKASEVHKGAVYISPEKQQLIGVTKDTVQKRQLVKEIRTVGKVAYDPDLAVVQTEFIQASAARKKLDDPSFKDVQDAKRRSDMLVEASRTRLKLLGMDDEQIDELAKQGEPERNLYLPPRNGAVWVYVTIYEYEIGFIKVGEPVEIEAVAYPGEIFEGKIISANPVLEATTRSLNVRAEIPNPDNKLKPEMFVNVDIKVDLGEKLAVADTAVMDTGTRKIAFVVNDNYFKPVELTLGNKIDDYYEVISGLKEGDVVVTSGNFLIDSESRLKAAIGK